MRLQAMEGILIHTYYTMYVASNSFEISFLRAILIPKSQSPPPLYSLSLLQNEISTCKQLMQTANKSKEQPAGKYYWQDHNCNLQLSFQQEVVYIKFLCNSNSTIIEQKLVSGLWPSFTFFLWYCILFAKPRPT
jgi:hypothetical protein